MWPDLGAVRDGIIFNLLNMVGGILWTLDRILLMVSSILHWFRVLLVGGGGQDNLLGILMTQLLQGNELLKQLVYLGLMLAFTIMSFTLIARPLIGRFQAVDFQKVILWFFIALLIFSAGPGMFAGLESTRLGLQEQAHLIASTIQYQNEVNRFNNQVVPDTVGDFWLPGQTPGYVPHLFGTAVGSDCPAGCNGLDAAAAFLGAEEGDITGARAEARNTGGYPQALYSRYFTWRDGNEEERAASVRNASDGVMRLLEGVLPTFFSIIEALIFLLFAIAAMVLFISLPVAIPFAFFSLTEIIAASVLRAYLFLVLRTFVVATMMAFLVQMLIIFAERGTVLVFVSISGLTILLSFQFVHMAAHTVTGALNVIGSAVGSATGMNARQVDPFAAAGRVAGMAALAGAAVATGGGAMLGAAALLHRQGGLRGGGLSAVGSAALHAARARAGAAVGRTPLRGLQRGYSAVGAYHQMAREHAYQLEAVRALHLDHDAEEAAAVLMEQKRVAPARKEWAASKVRQWTSVEERRQRYRAEMRGAGMSRLAHRGYSRSWKALNGAGATPTRPGPSPAAGSTGTTTGNAQGQAGANSRKDSGLDEHEMASSAPIAATGKQNALDGAGGSADPGVAAFSTAVVSSTRSRGRPSRSMSSAGVRRPGPNKPVAPVPTSDPLITTVSAILPLNSTDPALRVLAGEAVRLENRAVGAVGGYLLVYGGVRSEDDLGLGRYDLLPPGTDILDLLQKGKHVQKSRTRPGFLVAWEPDQATIAGSFSDLTLWSGTDSRARRQVLSDVRELADMAGQGLPLTAAVLQDKLRHLSSGDRQRLVGMLRGGGISGNSGESGISGISPEGMVSVLEATGQIADTMESAGNAQSLLEEFLAPNGYLDLKSPGVTSIVSQVSEVTSRGGEVHVQMEGAPNVERASSQQSGLRTLASPSSASSLSSPSGQVGQGAEGQGDGGVPPADIALLISAGLGLKRALPWAQVKGALMQASISDAHDPKHESVLMVSESLGVPSLRTSMAPVRRFVDTARSIGMPAADVSTVLEVAASARDIGEVIATIPAKDETTRHSRWSAAGVSPAMLHPLERVRSNVLQHAVGPSPAGTPDHKALERAQEMLGTLLIEGVSIRDELDDVPIETYSAHPFTVGGSGAAGPVAAYSTGPVAAAMPEATQSKIAEKVPAPQRASRRGKKQSLVPPPTVGNISRRPKHQAPGSLPVLQAGAEGLDAATEAATEARARVDEAGIDAVGAEPTSAVSDITPDGDEETGGNDAVHQS